ncbi:MAG: YdcH family protein [Burkholderiales bacterium]
MLPEQIAQIKRRIVELGIEHRDLDEVIARLVADPSPDELQLRRLKKRKLWLKDEIARLQMQITPDIPA